MTKQEIYNRLVEIETHLSNQAYIGGVAGAFFMLEGLREQVGNDPAVRVDTQSKTA